MGTRSAIKGILVRRMSSMPLPHRASSIASFAAKLAWQTERASGTEIPEARTTD